MNSFDTDSFFQILKFLLLLLLSDMLKTLVGISILAFARWITVVSGNYEVNNTSIHYFVKNDKSS